MWRLACDGTKSSSNLQIVMVTSTNNVLVVFLSIKTSVLGIDSMVTWNAISCLLQLPHEAGYQRAVKLSAMIPEYDSWADQDLLCIRLQMALRGQEYDKAQQIISDFGNFFYNLSHAVLR